MNFSQVSRPANKGTQFLDPLGTLSNYDDGGSENTTKKMNLRPFKLDRVYLEPLNSSNVGDFSWSWILKGFIHVEIEKGKFVVVCPRPPYNVALGAHVVVVQWTSKKCTKKRDSRAELLFCSLCQLFFDAVVVVVVVVA